MDYLEEDYLAPTSEVLYEAYGLSAIDPYSEEVGQDDFVCEELEVATGIRTWISGSYCFLEEAA